MNKEELILKSTHGGLLEAITMIKQARDKINLLMDDEEIKDNKKYDAMLGVVSENLVAGEIEVAEILGSIFYARFERSIGVQE